MKLLAWLLFFAQTDTVTFTGQVTDAITHLPVAGTQISFCCSGQGNATTDLSGSWSIQMRHDQAEGTLIATRPGYASGAARTNAATKKYDVELIPGAHISGRITDRDSGAPLVGFVVHAQGTGLQFISKASDSDGVFTIAAPLQPGAYTLEIDPPKGSAKGDTGYTRSWYPDVPRAEMTAPILVSAGESRVLDLRLQKRPLFRVGGVFEGGESQPVNIIVMGDPPNLRPVAESTQAANAPFRVEGLGAGSYSLVAFTKDRDGNPQTFATWKFEITDHSIGDLRLALRPGVSVRASVAMAEKDVAAPEHLMLIPAPFLALPFSLRLPDYLVSDGLPPGEYWPIVPAPEGYAVVSVSYNGKPVDHTPIDIEAPASVVQIVLTSRPGAVTGTVRDANRNAISGAVVNLLPALLPESLERFDSQAVRATDADGNGGFAFTDLAPGCYNVVALIGKDREHSRDLPFLRDRTQSSDPIEIDFGQTVNVELHVK